MPEPAYPDEEERLCRVQLANCSNVGPATYMELVEVYGSARQALTALPDLTARHHRSGAMVCTRDRAEEIVDAARSCSAMVITLGDPSYPALLQHSPAPPPVLFVKGDKTLLNTNCCAIVEVVASDGDAT